MKTDGPFITIDAINAIVKETAPNCFHCGATYIKDEKYCTGVFNTWMPDCDCIKRLVRITTGGTVLIDSYEIVPGTENGS